MAEKTISYHPEYHGVRLDVMAEEAGTKRRFSDNYLEYTRNESIGSTGGIGEFSEICWSGYG